MISVQSDIIDYGKEALKIEASVIQQLAEELNIDFEKAVKAILHTKGRLIVSGIGKSGLIGRKMAATFSSTGTPSFFLHPGEAFHGDLGMVGQEDIVLVISYSGETHEVINLLPYFKDNGNAIIALTGNPTSTLAKYAQFHLTITVSKEACPLDLAPTSSTTATLAMGDALAVVLMKIKNFKPENFARFHPGGTLGRRLLTKVRDVMCVSNLPLIQNWAPVSEIIHTISLCRLGLAVVVKENQLQGIITDGDIRRAMDNYQDTFFSLTAQELMNPTPKGIAPDAKLTEAAEMMNRYKINSLLVLEKQQVIGIIQVYDLKIG